MCMGNEAHRIVQFQHFMMASTQLPHLRISDIEIQSSEELEHDPEEPSALDQTFL